MLLHAKLVQSCLTLCDPMDYSPPGSSVHGVLQARLLEWVAMPSSRGYSQPRDQTQVSMSPALAGGFFTTSATWVMLFNHPKTILPTPDLEKYFLPQNQSLVPKRLGIAALRDLWSFSG